MKRKLTVSLIAILCVLLIGSSALAVTFEFQFENVTSTRDTGTAVTGERTNNYKVTLNSPSNVDANNIFGARPRRSSDWISAGSYYAYNALGTRTRSLNDTYDRGIGIFLRCKKDSASGIVGVLNIYGSFYV